MKLIVLTKQFGNYTGATVSTIEILKRISKQFDEVNVITLKSENIRIDNVTVQIAKSYRDLVKKVKKIKAKNLIGYSDDHLGFIFSFCNIRYIHTYHGNWPDAKYLNKQMYFKSFYFIPLYRMTIKRADFVVSVSQYMQKKFVNKYNDKSIVIFNGIKQVNHNFSKKNIDNKQRFLMVGNIDKRKYDKAIKIFYILNKYNFDKSIDIYGNLIDEKLAFNLKKYPFVKIKGMVDKVDYQNYDAMICTSASENLPVSIVESIISGVPVLSFNVGGIPEVIENKINGYLFSVNDYLGFSNSILNFKNLEIPTKNIKSINSKFNWDNSAKKYYQILKKVLEN